MKSKKIVAVDQYLEKILSKANNPVPFYTGSLSFQSYGIDLERKIGDIDVLVSEEVFNHLLHDSPEISFEESEQYSNSNHPRLSLTEPTYGTKIDLFIMSDNLLGSDMMKYQVTADREILTVHPKYSVEQKKRYISESLKYLNDGLSLIHI